MMHTPNVNSNFALILSHGLVIFQLAQMFKLNEQNTGAYKALSGQILALEKRLEDYHFEYIKLKMKVNLLEAELDDLDECVDRKTVIDLIHEIALSPNIKKCKDSSYSSESSEESDLVEIIEVREKKDALISNEGEHDRERLSKW